MDTENLESRPSKPSARRALAATLLYFLYLAVSFTALCFYVTNEQHSSAYFIILAWVVSVLVLPTPRHLLLNRRKKDR